MKNSCPQRNSNQLPPTYKTGARLTNVRKIRKNISTYEVRKNNLKIRKKCFTNAFVSFDRKLSNFVTYENNSVTTHAQLAFLLYFL